MASDPLTVGQVAFFLGVVPVLTAWIYSEVLCYAKHRAPAKEHLDVSLVELSSKDDEREHLLEAGAAEGGAAPVKAELAKNQTSQRIPIVNETFLVDNRGTLRSIAEFVGLMFYFFLCDRTTVLGESKKEYSRDLFIFLYLLLVLYSVTSSLKKHVEKSAVSGRSVMFLNRHQTEEWRGWMQVLFLMYHYFNAREIYNAIRVFIAAYVWMTGFGNFSYYYVRKDFSLGRFAQMMWRLNFLVFCTCVVLNNDYMLYYICPMHTFFTILVYGTLGIAHKYNEVPAIMAAKFLASFSLIVIIWEIPGVFEFVWSPLTFLMKYKNPHKFVNDYTPLREWHFRSGLDRYVWMVGMLYAYFHPNVERLLEKWEELEYRARVASKAIVLSVTLAAGYLWFEHVYKLDKQEYNKLHPYTSWIPISVFIVLRNFSQPLRNWSLTLFAWLGKITLETYIGQFHIWLRTGMPNGQPRFLLSVIPDYPLLNLTFTTAAYVLVSYRLFQLTNVLKTAFVPGSDNKRLFHMFVSGSIIAVSLYGISYLLVAVPKFFVWAV